MKMFLQSIKISRTKLILITLIITIGVILSNGLGQVSNVLKQTYQNIYNEANMPDIIVSSQTVESDLIKIEALTFVKETLTLSIIDDEHGFRIETRNFDNQSIAKLDLISGRYPENANEVIVEKPTDKIRSYEIGSLIEVNHQSYQVVGIVSNPFYYYQKEIYNHIGIPIHTIIYQSDLYVNNQNNNYIYVDLNHHKVPFTDGYYQEIEALSEELRGLDIFVVEQKDFLITQVVQSYIDKMDLIGLVFPLFFMLVIIIVVVASLRRMILDERREIAILKSLGFSKFYITFKYYMMVFSVVVLGVILGIGISYSTLLPVVIDAFKSMFLMPKVKVSVDFVYMVNLFLILLISLSFVVYLLTQITLKEVPASLLRPKAPKSGHKLVIERIPFIWKRLKFKYKSSIRNVFRYKLNFMITLLSVSGSTALMIAGFGLRDNTIEMSDMFGTSLELIAVIIILAAGLLSVLVLYNLTNMNIEERKREIATLKVLGYKKAEVAMYMYREIFIVSLLGIFLGLPIGYYLLKFLFNYIDFGLLEHVKIVSWIYTVLISLCFVIVSEILLFGKISKLDMNESLKSVE